MFDKIWQLFTKSRKKSKVEERIGSRTILIVDDNEGDRLLVQKTIERMGHNALIAKNGRMGLQMAKEQKPDLILSDCRMPEMDGIEMCRLLKEDDETKDIRLVFLTGIDSPRNVVECFDLGVDNYMCKPINAKLLTSQIQAIFEEFFLS